jgi:hypothetical protein
MKRVKDDSTHVRNTAFLLWIFAFLVCLAVLGFIVFGYIGHALDGLPRLS